MLLSREDVEYIWNELSIYLHLVLIAAFLFIGLYAWRLSPKLSMVIIAADIIFILSTLNALLKRARMRKPTNPYSEEFKKHTKTFVICGMSSTATEDLDKVSDSMTEAICKEVMEAYNRGFLDGQRN